MWGRLLFHCTESLHYSFTSEKMISCKSTLISRFYQTLYVIHQLPLTTFYFKSHNFSLLNISVIYWWRRDTWNHLKSIWTRYSHWNLCKLSLQHVKIITLNNEKEIHNGFHVTNNREVFCKIVLVWVNAKNQQGNAKKRHRIWLQFLQLISWIRRNYLMYFLKKHTGVSTSCWSSCHVPNMS